MCVCVGLCVRCSTTDLYLVYHEESSRSPSSVTKRDLFWRQRGYLVAQTVSTSQKNKKQKKEDIETAAKSRRSVHSICRLIGLERITGLDCRT